MCIHVRAISVTRKVLLTNMSILPEVRLKAYIEAVPKIELHVHIEGTLEPEEMFHIGERNKVQLKGTPETYRRSRNGEASRMPILCILLTTDSK